MLRINKHLCFSAKVLVWFDFFRVPTLTYMFYNKNLSFILLKLTVPVQKNMVGGANNRLPGLTTSSR
jgi:hypothetical protein